MKKEITKIYVILNDGKLEYWQTTESEAAKEPGKIVGAIAVKEYSADEKTYQEYFKLQLEKGLL